MKALRWDMLHYPLRNVTTQKNRINTNAVQTSYLHISTVNFSVRCETYESARTNTSCCSTPHTANRRDFLHNQCRCPLVYPKFHLGRPIVFVSPPHLYGTTAPYGPGPPHYRGITITHNDTPNSVGLLWTSDRPDAETSTWQQSCVCVHLQGSCQSPSTRLGVLVVISDCLVIYLQKLRGENDLQLLRITRRCSWLKCGELQ